MEGDGGLNMEYSTGRLLKDDGDMEMEKEEY